MLAVPRLATNAIRRSTQISSHIQSPSRSTYRTMSSITKWDRLIRYVSAKDGKTKYGEPIVSGDKPDIDDLAQKGGLKVKVLEGPTPIQAAPTGEEDEVKQLLGPLTPEDVSIKLASTSPPTQPSSSSPRKPCKNVSEADALSYVAGYVSSNDVSCRDWQMEKDKAGMMPQWSFSKSFDKYAPLGPCIVSTKLLGDAGGLAMKTFVNGELRQDTNTSDLCFGVRKLVSVFSTGQTLEAGSLIMTGTPGGVGFGMKPPKWLKDGDEVVVEIEGIGKVVNKMHFE
ncbi:hypothetical protein LTR12_015819 [Friedmanniomyces endolithicus]|nr:hypothetical protein LTR12_015819 [Friedmanniomyces endolithicus]